MAGDKIAVGDKMACAMAAPGNGGDMAVAQGQFGMVCWEKGPDGNPRQVWAQTAYNGVNRQGLAMFAARLFVNNVASTNGPFIFLHQINYGAASSTYNWQQVSTVLVGGWNNGSLKTFDTTGGLSSQSDMSLTTYSAAASISFSHAGTSTVSGAGMLFYTNTSCASNAASNDIKIYNIGTFTAAQAVQSNNTLSITVSLSLNTA
jgi:hypothetical protein